MFALACPSTVGVATPQQYRTPRSEARKSAHSRTMSSKLLRKLQASYTSLSNYLCATQEREHKLTGPDCWRLGASLASSLSLAEARTYAGSLRSAHIAHISAIKVFARSSSRGAHISYLIVPSRKVLNAARRMFAQFKSGCMHMAQPVLLYSRILISTSNAQ